MKIVKLLMGIFFFLLILSVATMGVLSIWGIHVIEWKVILNIILSAGIVGVCLFVLWIVGSLFFKKGI